MSRNRIINSKNKKIQKKKKQKPVKQKTNLQERKINEMGSHYIENINKIDKT